MSTSTRPGSRSNRRPHRGTAPSGGKGTKSQSTKGSPASTRSTTLKGGKGAQAGKGTKGGNRKAGAKGLGGRPNRAMGPPRRQRTLLLWLGLVTAFAAGMVFLFFYSSAFVVKDVQVSGGREAVQAEALNLAQIPNGRPLAKVAEGPISERVLQDQRIAAVEVEREWPSTVRLVITEREPALALRGSGAAWLADANGYVYEQTDDPSNRLPLITMRGKPEELDRATVTGLAELWRMRPDPAVLEGDLSAPTVDAQGHITMKVGQVTLQWGPPVENEKKWQVVAGLIGHESVDPQGGIPIKIDLRLPDQPVVTGLPESFR